EAPNFIAALDKADHFEPSLQTSCGKPTIFCETSIRDADGAALALGEVGEICVRGPYTLARYHDDPERTEKAFWRDPGGDWLRTGDVGRQSQTGHLYLVDRAKDMIISGGMNVYSTEVENVVQDHPDVAQVMVIGVPDDDWGEAVAAFVVPAREGIDLEDVRAFARARLAAYKAPKRIETLDAIPVTAYGKPDKKAIRARFWEGRGRAIN
ncbi:MAG: acyl-CoA synthetase, partial [Pseudomonadota bacterium]